MTLLRATFALLVLLLLVDARVREPVLRPPAGRKGVPESN